MEWTLAVALMSFCAVMIVVAIATAIIGGRR